MALLAVTVWGVVRRKQEEQSGGDNGQRKTESVPWHKENGRELDIIQVLLSLAQCQHGISPGTHGLVGMARFAYL